VQIPRRNAEAAARDFYRESGILQISNAGNTCALQHNLFVFAAQDLPFVAMAALLDP
jgi:hypothetical protein